MHSGVQVLEAHQHALFRHLKNEFFSRNLGQNMPKNAYFLEYRPQTPALLLPFTDINWSKRAFLALKLFYYFEK